MGKCGDELFGVNIGDIVVKYGGNMYHVTETNSLFASLRGHLVGSDPEDYRVYENIFLLNIVDHYKSMGVPSQ